MRFPHAVLAICALGAAMPTRLPAQFEDVVVDDLRLEIALDHEDRKLSGSATLRIRNDGEANVRRVPVLLGRLLRIDGVSEAPSHPQPESSNATAVVPIPLEFTQDIVRFPDWEELQVLETWIELRSPLATGESVALTIDYAGTIVGYTETGMQYVRDRIDPEFTLIRSDAFSFPTLGEASLASLRRQRQSDFTFSGSVRVSEEHLAVASAGDLTVERDPGGTYTWRFSSRGPAPFLFLAVADYDVLETDDAKIYHFPEDSAGAARLARALTDATRLYSDWFGQRADSRKVVIMEIPEGWGSQASLAGGIIQTADAFRQGDQLPQMYHEVAHLWHPAETERPADRWNEGFATFLQWRVEHHGDPAALETRMTEMADRVLARGIDDLPPMDRYGELDRTGLAYRVGPLFFYSLYEVLGADGFDRCLSSFFSEFEEAGYTSADFVSEVSSCGRSASLALDDWFTSTAGLRRLDSGTSLQELVRSYRDPG